MVPDRRGPGGGPEGCGSGWVTPDDVNLGQDSRLSLWVHVGLAGVLDLLA